MSAHRARHGGMTADKSRTRPARDLLNILWDYLVIHKSKLITISLVILVYTILATAQPIIIQQAIDEVIGDDASSSRLTWLIIFFITISFLVWFFQSVNVWLMADVQTKMLDDIRSDTFKSVIEADMSYHHKNQSGDITARVVSDTDQIALGLNVFTQTATHLLLILATLGVLLYIHYLFVVVALLAVPVAMLMAKFFGTVGKKRMLRTRQAYGKVSGKLAENLAGVSIAKAFNQEERVSKEIRVLNDQVYEHSKLLGFVFILVFPAISMVSTLLIFGILFLGGYLTTITNMSPGTIFLGTLMVQRFLQPIIQLARDLTQLQASLAAIDRVVDILDAQSTVQERKDAQPLNLTQGVIEFKGVDFAYETNTQVLSKVSFEILSGEKVALVGHTGAGKTTITSLLMRFYDPSSGNIFIDGQNLKDLTFESLYENLSIVSQEPYLFADTVMENIRYGMKDATDEEIIDLCTLIGADQFIEALPQGYDTLLQESGKSLSAGQRQMITIVRTMLSDPKILVLDEATSRLDAYSESLVQRAQHMLFEGRTTLIIAHRLSTIRDVDKIIVLDEGKIIEQGTHEELLRLQGGYSELYNYYYRHQGTEELEYDVLSDDESSTLVLQRNGGIILQNLIQKQVEVYQTRINGTDKRIKFNDTEKEIVLPVSEDQLSQSIDEVYTLFDAVISSKQKSSLIEIKLHKNNGSIEVWFTNSRVVLDDKAKSILQTHGSLRTKGKTVEEIIKESGGVFYVVSPLPETSTGCGFKTTFKLN